MDCGTNAKEAKKKVIYVETAAASVSFLLQLILLLPHKCISKLKAERYIISKGFLGKEKKRVGKGRGVKKGRRNLGYRIILERCGWKNM